MTQCGWGRDFFTDQEFCQREATTKGFLHKPKDRTLEGVELNVCEEHLIAIVELSNPPCCARLRSVLARIPALLKSLLTLGCVLAEGWGLQELSPSAFW